MLDITSTFLNAYTFGFGEKQGFTHGESWKHSLRALRETTRCNAIILPVCAWQDHAYSTQVDSRIPDVMDEGDVARVCAYAGELGLKVILKVMVNCRDGYWRAYIRFFDSYVPTEPLWSDWFASYGQHALRVAQMAEDNHADMLCIGCEMVGTDHREKEWREIAYRVREVYTGPVTYNCDKYPEDQVKWWDAMDVISSSGYYPIDALQPNFDRIRRVAEQYGKPFMFMECGCPSRKMSEYRPNDWRFGEGLSLDAQAQWYEAFVSALEVNPFIRGTGWWDWSATRLYPAYAGADNSGYCTFGKPANDILAAFAKRLSEGRR